MQEYAVTCCVRIFSQMCQGKDCFVMQVVVYQYTKLQQMKAKAALSTTKDVEKMGGGAGGGCVALPSQSAHRQCAGAEGVSRPLVMM